MTNIAFERDGWIEAALGDPGEDRTFTRLTLRVGATTLTRNFSKRGGGESDAINVPLYPLVRAMTENWWPLLYEPIRPRISDRFRARHRLDLAMHGYVFPAVALCSAGEDSILLDWQLTRSDLSSLEFLTPPPPEPVLLERTQVETTLMDLVESALSRLSRNTSSFTEVNASWARIASSMADPEELAYCVAAGRLGIDPYDPEGPDLTNVIEGLPRELVNDLSDAAELTELTQAASWIREAREEMNNAPRVEIAAFGEPVRDNLGEPGWTAGWRAANLLRAHLGLDINRPRQAVSQLLDGAVRTDRALHLMDPTSTVTALISRDGGAARIGAVAHTARQQRFRACAATYIAWCSHARDERAATVGLTRLQQASRAFAAELLAPRQLLRDRAGQFGLTADMIGEIANSFICPHDAVVLQAFNEGIPLKGVEVPAYRRTFLA